MMTLILYPLTPADIDGDAAALLRDAPNRALVADVVASSIEGQRALYERTKPDLPWIGYFAVDSGSRDIVGMTSFVCHADEPSREIAYFTFPPYEGRGVARAMARALLAIAAADPEAPPLHAFTLPEENASTAVLRGCGFVRDGTGNDHEVGEVWRWALPAIAS